MTTPTSNSVIAGMVLGKTRFHDAKNLFRELERHDNQPENDHEHHHANGDEHAVGLFVFLENAALVSNPPVRVPLSSRSLMRTPRGMTMVASDDDGFLAAVTGAGAATGGGALTGLPSSIFIPPGRTAAPGRAEGRFR